MLHFALVACFVACLLLSRFRMACLHWKARHLQIRPPILEIPPQTRRAAFESGRLGFWGLRRNRWRFGLVGAAVRWYIAFLQ